MSTTSFKKEIARIYKEIDRINDRLSKLDIADPKYDSKYNAFMRSYDRHEYILDALLEGLRNHEKKLLNEFASSHANQSNTHPNL